MIEYQIKHLSVRVGLVWLILMSPFCLASEDLGEILRHHYVELDRARSTSENPLPFSLESVNNSSNSHASLRYFLDGVSFDEFVVRLQQAPEWCEFIPLHLNIKACAYLERNGKTLLQFYAGIKGYVTPDKAHLLQLEFNSNFSDGVFTANLFAADGPLDSENINFDIRAIGIEQDGRKGVYLEFDLSSVPGLAADLMRIYLATIARKKVGFSVSDTSWTGKPVYVSGPRGATERNIVRYLLAIETYFATLDLPPDSQYAQRLEQWFDATEQYPEQLHELARQEYLDNKFRERANQEILQHATTNKIDPIYKPKDRNR